MLTEEGPHSKITQPFTMLHTFISAKAFAQTRYDNLTHH
uniref:Uncharacterized protein n=1 Tax=Rhizophora mucronata TaxID=61149 RepID=A0A2P2MYC4_RHIMU